MGISQRLRYVLAGVLAGALVAGGGYAIAAGSQRTPRAKARASEPAVIHACVSERTHQIFLREACGAGYYRVSWSRQPKRGLRGARGPEGPRGATGQRGPAGLTGLTGQTGSPGQTGLQGPKGDTGAAGANGTANAWGEIWPTDNSDQGVIAPGSQNVLAFQYVGPGDYEVTVSNCTATSPEAASIQISPGYSAYDPDAPVVSGPVVAESDDGVAVSAHPGEVDFYVTLYDLKTMTDVDSDFSFTVNC